MKKKNVILVFFTVASIFIFPFGLCTGLPLGEGDIPPLTLLQAVTHTIKSNTAVLLAKQDVRQKKAEVKIEKGDQDLTMALNLAFDDNKEPMTPYQQSVYHKDVEKTQTFTTTLSLEKTFENGIRFGPTITLKRYHDGTLADDPTDNHATVEFAVDVPLMEVISRIKCHTSGLASKVQLESELWNMAATVSGSIRDTAHAFWDALAEKLILDLYKQAESDAKSLYNDMALMVRKNEYPAVNLNRLEANLGAKTINRISQEQALYTARQVLAIRMGASLENLMALPDIRGKFPAVMEIVSGIKPLISYATLHRPDLTAYNAGIRYYSRLAEDARRHLLPSLDLTIGIGSKGLLEEDRNGAYLEAITSNVPGPSYRVGLSFIQKFGNYSAKGELIQSRVRLMQTKIERRSLEKTAYSDVLNAFQNYKNSIRTLKKQREVVEKYRLALEKEWLKFKYQMADLSDLLAMQNDYRDSKINLIHHRKIYAKSVISLRYACGSLVLITKKRFSVSQDQLLSPVWDFAQ